MLITYGDAYKNLEYFRFLFGIWTIFHVSVPKIRFWLKNNIDFLHRLFRVLFLVKVRCYKIPSNWNLNYP